MTTSTRLKLTMFVPALLLLAHAGGCSSYAVPGKAAELSMFADKEIRVAYQRKPASPLPARLAVVRVQGPGYTSYGSEGHASGNYTVVTTRDVEEEADYKKISGLADVAGVATLNRLMINPKANDDTALRQAAATLGADMILLYTFDTGFEVRDGAPPLSVITLGLFPTKVANVTTTASSLLMDVRTGYIYATGEATAKEKPLMNSWNREDAVDQSRHDTERKAFVKMVDDFARVWPQVVAERRKSLVSQ